MVLTLVEHHNSDDVMAAGCTGIMPGNDNDPADQQPTDRRQRRTKNSKATQLRVSDSVEFVQINLQHNKAASALLCKQMAEMQCSVILIQEPWINKNKILGLNSKGSTHFWDSRQEHPRTCVITKGLEAYCLPQFSSRDQTAVCIKYNNAKKEQSVMVASVYMPMEFTLPSGEMEQLIQYCNDKNIPLILGCDTNAHHFWWGSNECNNRGYILSEYLASTNLEVVNQGCEPTFSVGNKQTVIDVTLASRPMIQEICNWKVNPEDTFSDHRKIQFTLKQDKRPSIRRRNIKQTNWDVYERELNAQVGLWFGRVETPADIEQELTKVNSAIIKSFEKACPARRSGGRYKVPWWSHELRTLRQKANKAFHVAYKTGQSKDWENHRAARRAFKKALRCSKRQSWINFCTQTEGIHESARLYKILGHSPVGKLGMLRLPDGQWTTNLEEAYNHLLETHFPGCKKVNDEPSKPTPRWAPSFNRQEVQCIITEDRIKWAFGTMAPFKTPGQDGVYPILLQKGLQYILRPVCSIYRASLSLGYIPKIWRETRVTFVPKPGKIDYTNAKAFRPISLTSFLLKGMEKLVDRHLRDGPLTEIPIHPRQHAFQAGKSTESALHHLVGRLERALAAEQYALGVFFDIQGAFDNISSGAVRQALHDRKVIFAVRNWIGAVIEQRTVFVRVGQTLLQVITQCGLPQGGGLSPTLWSLVADSLLKWLTKQGVFAQGFADDGVIVIVGKVLNTICEIMQRILRGVEKWCTDRELSVNPGKTETMLFTRKYKPDALGTILFYGKELELTTQVKYLGVIIDPKLNWRLHVEAKCDKALISIHQLRRSVGKTWGISPKIAQWIYTAIIRPTITYAAVVWWSRVDKKVACNKLNHIQRLACLYITGAVRTTPTLALEIIVGLRPLDIHIKQEAMLSCYRMRINGQWTQTYCGHTGIINSLTTYAPLSQMRSDKTLPQYIFDKNYIVSIPSKEDWSNREVEIPDDIICFTDGSRHRGLGKSGASVYNQTTNQEQVLPLGKYSTVFQAEVYAILACVNSLHSEYDASIAICSDSQAALMALDSAKITSKLVVETVMRLKQLSLFNSVRLLWVPGHFGVTGNESADRLAKQATCEEFIGPEPRIGITMMAVRTEVRAWADRVHHKLWQSADGCRQAKMFIHGPDKQLSRFALGLKRKQLRVLAGLLTGHIALNRHLTVMKIRTDPLCPACGEEEETSYHLLGKCAAYMLARYSILGAYLMEPEELGKVSLTTLLRFVKATKRIL